MKRSTAFYNIFQFKYILKQMAGTVLRPLEKKIYFLINRIFNIDLSLSALISNPGTSLPNQLMNLLIFLVNHSM